MDKSGQISVVIPVYNVEKYLEKCLDSVVRQTYKDLEIILVDDGSTDRSGAICDKYANSDNRIIVIHQSNGGLSDARNKGINIATGRYIGFIDSDDYVSDDYFEVLHKLITSGPYQISICNPLYVYESDDEILPNKKIGKCMCMTSEDALATMLYQNYYDTSAWGKLYERRLFDDVKYPEGRLYEDLGTTYKLILKSENVIFIDKELYFYLQRDNSISAMKYNHRKDDYLFFAEEIFQEVQEKNLGIKNAAGSRCISVACNLLLQMYGVDKELLKSKRSKMYDIIVKYRKGLITDNKVRRKNKLIIFLSYLPFCVFDRLFYIIRGRNKRVVKTV